LSRRHDLGLTGAAGEVPQSVFFHFLFSSLARKCCEELFSYEKMVAKSFIGEPAAELTVHDHCDLFDPFEGGSVSYGT